LFVRFPGIIRGFVVPGFSILSLVSSFFLFMVPQWQNDPEFALHKLQEQKKLLLSENELIICFHGHVPASHSCLPFLGHFGSPQGPQLPLQLPPSLRSLLSLSLSFSFTRQSSGRSVPA
jgi:hypothetical protein